MPAVLVPPVSVEVDENVDSSIQVTALVEVEVRMDRELALRQDLLKSAPAEVGVADQSFDPGELFEEVEKHPRVELVQKVANERRQAAEFRFLELSELSRLVRRV